MDDDSLLKFLHPYHNFPSFVYNIIEELAFDHHVLIRFAEAIANQKMSSNR
jgi:hypothetical protein